MKYSAESNGGISGGYIDRCYHHAAENPIYWEGLNIDGYTQAGVDPSDAVIDALLYTEINVDK